MIPTITFADAFASNLVDTGIGCMTELSTDEVIMNEEVKPPEESDFPRMHLAVLDSEGAPMENEPTSIPYKYDPTIKTIQLAFVNPYTADEFHDDLQFVVEVAGPTEDSGAAEFVSGGSSIGCEKNKRVSGRLMDGLARVVLQINDPTVQLRVWGGWATGHNAVRLTPALLLEPGQPGSAANEKGDDEPPSGDEEDDEEAIEELEEEIMEEEFKNTDHEKALREQEEEKLEKLLHGGSSESSDEEEEEHEDPANILDNEELYEEKQEEKLLKLLGKEAPDMGGSGSEDDENSGSGDSGSASADEEETKAEHEDEDEPGGSNQKKQQQHHHQTHGLQRKRKNPLAKPDSVPEGLIDTSKINKDLGLEIARTARARGHPGAAIAGTASTT